MCLRVCVSSGLMHEDFWFSCLRVLSEQGCFIITGFCTNSLISFYNLLLRTSFFCRDEEIRRMIRVLCRRTILQSPFACFFFLQGWGDSSHDQGAAPQDHFTISFRVLLFSAGMRKFFAWSGCCAAGPLYNLLSRTFFFCRDEEIRRMIRVLCRRTKNNPVLIGDPGVGKASWGLEHIFGK